MQPQYPGASQWQTGGGWAAGSGGYYPNAGVPLPRYVEFVAGPQTAQQMRSVAMQRGFAQPKNWLLLMCIPAGLLFFGRRHGGGGVIGALAEGESVEWGMAFGGFLFLLIPCLLGILGKSLYVYLRGDDSIRWLCQPGMRTMAYYGHTEMVIPDYSAPTWQTTIPYSAIKEIKVYQHVVVFRLAGEFLLPRGLVPDDVLPLFPRSQ